MRILFLGDFYFDYDNITDDFAGISRFIKENGYQTVLNLETSLSNKGEKIKKRGPNLSSSTATIEALSELNTIVVSMANNHTMDYGTVGLLETLNILDSKNIKHVGAGLNSYAAQRECSISAGNNKLFFLNYGWNVEETVYASENNAGCAPLNRDKIEKEIARLKKMYPNSKVVCLFHWGFEYNTLPMPIDIRFAHRCIDAGCDLIIGHHPHVIQPKEEYHGKMIYYSLGNFYFGGRRTLFNKVFPLEKVKNYCDIGAAVLIDTEEWTIIEHEIRYDRTFDTSTIIENENVVPYLEKCDWNSLYYRNLVKKHAMKHNPVLTGFFLTDYIRILVLYSEYILYSFLKNLKSIFLLVKAR